MTGAVIALKEGKPVEPYHVFLSGPGGVGKSHVIKSIHSDTLKLLKLSGVFEPDDVIALLTAPTGVAAFNISGMTLHSALLLGRSKYSGFQPLSHDRLRSKLSRLMLVINPRRACARVTVVVLCVCVSAALICN